MSAINACRRCGGRTLAISPVFSDTKEGDYLVGHISAYARCTKCGAEGPIGENIAEAFELWNQENPEA